MKGTDRPHQTISLSDQKRVVRLLSGRMSFCVDKRSFVVSLMLFTVAACLLIFAILSGKYTASPAELVSAVARGDDVVRMIVLEWRLPRACLAFLIGAALGLSGAIFQSLTRNPLGSPDVIGFSAGAHSGALVVILLMSGGYYQIAAGALAGGVVTALAVYLLAYRRGIQGFRLIIVGIGVAAMLSAVNAWMIRDVDLLVAMSAAIWSSGSLNGLGVEQLIPVAVVLGLLMPLLAGLSRPMAQLEMGDDTARASGLNVGRVRLGLMVTGVALTAIATSVAGPISFISLCAPQLARRLTGSAGIGLTSAGLMGGVLLLAADWAAQHAFGVQLPVGVMTVSLGGIYFIWLLVREGRG